MADATLTPSILNHLFRNGGIGPELNNEIIDGGHADDASKLTEPFTLSLGTDASGSVSIDGSKDVTLDATVAKATQLRTSQNFSLTGDVTASAIGFNGTGAVALSTKLAAISDSTSSSSSSTAASSAAVKSLNDALSKLTDRVSELEDDISSGVPMMPTSSTISGVYRAYTNSFSSATELSTSATAVSPQYTTTSGQTVYLFTPPNGTWLYCFRFGYWTDANMYSSGGSYFGIAAGGTSIGTCGSSYNGTSSTESSSGSSGSTTMIYTNFCWRIS